MWSMWKTVGITLKGINVLQLWGEGPICIEMLWTQSATYVFGIYQYFYLSGRLSL